MAQSCWSGHRRSSALLQLQLAAGGGGGGGGGAAVAIPVPADHSPETSAEALAHHLHHHLQYRHVAADVEDELAMETIERLASENAVVMFSLSSCCMCHVVKRLLCGMGVNLTVYELDELEAMGGQQLMNALARFVGSADAAVPAVFIGGKFVGGLDHVMAAHISGALVPLLKQAGALWL